MDKPSEATLVSRGLEADDDSPLVRAKEPCATVV